MNDKRKEIEEKINELKSKLDNVEKEEAERVEKLIESFIVKNKWFIKSMFNSKIDIRENVKYKYDTSEKQVIMTVNLSLVDLNFSLSDYIQNKLGKSPVARPYEIKTEYNQFSGCFFAHIYFQWDRVIGEEPSFIHVEHEDKVKELRRKVEKAKEERKHIDFPQAIFKFPFIK